MALALMLQGTLVHRGKEALAKAGLFVLPLFAIVLAAMMVSVYGQDASRYIVFDPLVILITLAIGLHLAHWSRPVRFSARNLSAFYLLALSAAFFVRWSVVLASDNKAEVLANPFHGYLYLVLISVTIAWNCCIILMCNERAHTKATDIANTDPLTRLPNRRSFEVNLHQSICAAPQAACAHHRFRGAPGRGRVRHDHPRRREPAEAEQHHRAAQALPERHGAAQRRSRGDPGEHRRRHLAP